MALSDLKIVINVSSLKNNNTWTNNISSDWYANRFPTIQK